MEFPEHSFALQGFAVNVGWATGLAVEDEIGCELQVLSGQAWITVEGDSQDIVADEREPIRLQPGVRYYVSAFRDAATILVNARATSRVVDFSLKVRGGVPVLTACAGRGAFRQSPSRIAAAIASTLRRSLPAALAAPA
jgi:hypothetical protein